MIRSMCFCDCLCNPFLFLLLFLSVRLSKPKNNSAKDIFFTSFFCHSLFITFIGRLPHNLPFISFIALIPSKGSEKATKPYPWEPLYILFNNTSLCKRWIALTKLICKNLCCHFTTQIPNKKTKIGFIPIIQFIKLKKGIHTLVKDMFDLPMFLHWPFEDAVLTF